MFKYIFNTVCLLILLQLICSSTSETFRKNKMTENHKFNLEAVESQEIKEQEKDRGNYGSSGGDMISSANCPKNIRCIKPPIGVICTEYATYDHAAIRKSEGSNDCCPILQCHRPNGSKYLLYGIEIEENNIFPQKMPIYSGSNIAKPRSGGLSDNDFPQRKQKMVSLNSKYTTPEDGYSICPGVQCDRAPSLNPPYVNVPDYRKQCFPYGYNDDEPCCPKGLFCYSGDNIEESCSIGWRCKKECNHY